MAKTHSFTWDEFISDALSDLHPWELYRYGLREYLLRRKGVSHKRRIFLQQEYQHFRHLAYYSILPDLTPQAQRKSIDQIIPDIYDTKPAPIVDINAFRERIRNKYGSGEVTRKMLKDGG